jgi:hypothetical protein
MRRRKPEQNGLQEAVALLLNAQANLANAQASFMSRADERFASIDRRLSHIEAILLRHEQTLQALPEAIREKIGVKRPNKKST